MFLFVCFLQGGSEANNRLCFEIKPIYIRVTHIKTTSTNVKC